GEQVEVGGLAGQQGHGAEDVVEDVAGEEVEGSAEEGEGRLGHARHLEAQQLRVAAGEGAVEVNELGDGVAHEDHSGVKRRMRSARAGYCAVRAARSPPS